MRKSIVQTPLWAMLLIAVWMLAACGFGGNGPAQPPVATEPPPAATEPAPADVPTPEPAEESTAEPEEAVTPESDEPEGDEAEGDEAEIDEAEIDEAETGADATDESLVAQVVVQFDDHALAIRTVGFAEPVSGLELLEQSGLAVVTADTGFGPAVCSIESVGCPAEDCFCGGDFFWGYSYWDGDGWEGYPVGASSSVISATGTIEGWRWGEWGAPAVPAPQAQAVDAGLSWLASQQDAQDGGYNGSVAAGLETLFALGANHQRGADLRAAEGAPSVLDFVLENGIAFAGESPSQAGKFALGLVAGQGCYPVDAPLPTAFFDAEQGTMAPEAGPLALALLGALAFADDAHAAESDAPGSDTQEGEPNGPIAASLAYLRELAQADGGWEWFPGWGADSNTTALAIQALVAAGVEPDAPEIVAAIARLAAVQNADGGFPYDLLVDGDGPSDANSTAYAIQALIAAGETVDSDGWRQSGNSPVDYLLGLQLDTGAFVWQPGQEANQLATQQAIVALLGRTHPINAGTLTLCAP